MSSTRNRKPTHPGSVFKFDVLEAMDITISDAAKAMKERLEELEDLSDYREIKAALARGDEELIPEEIVDRLAVESPVKVWREYRGLKQKELADKSGVKTSMLSQIENGKKSGSIDTLKAIAKVLRVDIDDLSPSMP